MHADLFINPSTEKLSAVLKNHVPQGMFHVIIDTTGDSNVLNMMPGYLSNQGRLVMVGQPAPGVSLEIPNALDLFNGSGNHHRNTRRPNPPKFGYSTIHKIT